MEFYNFIRYIGVSEVVDILVMSVLVYLVLLGIRRTRSDWAIRGILIVGVIYLLARQFDLYLTASVLSAFFAVFIVAMIVIFRNELHQLFEQIASWQPATAFNKFRTPTPHRDEIELLARTLADLARDRIGALIVLPGANILDNYLHGGVALNGELSESLLKSLFDNHSIGHDGAMIICRGRVTRFSCHLPLSTAFDILGNHGTRHAAALGLAELTDAMCLVVSEEHGTISVAHRGRLLTLNSAQDDPLLASFLGATDGKPQPHKTWNKELIKKVFQRDLLMKGAALGIAVLMWFVLVYGNNQTMWQSTLMVQYSQLPADLEVVDIAPPQITLSFSGALRNFYFLNKGELRLQVPLNDVKPGKNYRRITVTNLTYPRDLSLRRILPNRVRFSIRRKKGHPSSGSPR